MSSAEVLAEATALYERWPTMTTDEKRRIAEVLIQKIVIGDGEIDITFTYLPTSEEAFTSQQQGKRLGRGRTAPTSKPAQILPPASSERPVSLRSHGIHKVAASFS